MPNTLQPSTKPLILKVVTATPLRRTFEYLAATVDYTGQPINAADIKLGARLQVPFGNSKRIGVLVGITDSSSVAIDKLKPCDALIDREPFLTPEMLRLAKWASTYYHHSLGDICFKMLPTLLRKKSEFKVREQRFWQYSAESEHLQQQLVELKNAPKQHQLLNLIANANKPIAESELKAKGFNKSQIDALVSKQWLKAVHQPLLTLEGHSHSQDAPPKLTQEQQVVVDNFKLTGFKVSLLDGITGSGKTEVYLNLIEQCLAKDQSALLLVPEIGLTPQTLGRFQKRFDVAIALLHSGLSEQERLENYLAAASGKAKILIGTRSALFAPMPKLGLIILDEEHDASFKSQRGWMFSARDMAIIRAKQADIPIMLGSATASLETLHHALTGNYQHLLLTKRANAIKPASIKVLDVKKLPMQHGISMPLIKQIKHTLDAGKQVMIFINRRGYAPIYMCHDCGWIAECQRCETSYTLHQSPAHLHCHHCLSSKPIVPTCPECTSSNIGAVGIGTERVEQYLAEQFPNEPLIRVDRDSTRNKGAMEQIVEQIKNNHYRILIGTQMLAKGHHFSNLELVAILDMDSALFSSDFRAPEKFAQLVTQVTGRVGRGDSQGKIILQTHHPEHPLLSSLMVHGYANFAKQLLEERKMTQWPPFSYLAMLRVEASYQSSISAFFNDLSAITEQIINQYQLKVNCLGPVPAPIAKVAGKFRHQLLIQANDRKQLHILLNALVKSLESQKIAKRVRWSLEVDPIEMV